jgi:DNA adenine methylase
MFPYIGGKQKQSTWIESHLPRDMNLYVEPFGGAFWNYIKGSFNAKEVVYNDFNKFMSNMFACSKQPDKFLSYLNKVKAQDRQLFDKFKYEILSIKDNFNIPDFNIATMYIYIVTQTFSGIMSEKVQMIDLHGKYTSKYYAFINKLKNRTIRKRLDKVTVYNLSYDQILDMYDTECFDKNRYFYLDPPYYQKEHLYAFHEFGKDNHKELSNKLKSLNSRWILSYYEYDELAEWFPNDKYIWTTMDFKKSSMASEGKEQSVATELLIMNYRSVYSLI